MEGKLKNAKQELYRDLYLFCASRFVVFDMRNLTEENIRTYFDEHEWININRQKTGCGVQHPYARHSEAHHRQYRGPVGTAGYSRTPL